MFTQKPFKTGIYPNLLKNLKKWHKIGKIEKFGLKFKNDSFELIVSSKFDANVFFGLLTDD